MNEWIVFSILYFSFPQDFFQFRKKQHNTQISISEYFPLFGRTHLLFASITTAWRDDSAMNDSHQHGRSRRQFSILQQKARDQGGGDLCLLFPQILLVSSSSLCCQGSQFNFPGIVPQFLPLYTPLWPPLCLPYCFQFVMSIASIMGASQGLESGCTIETNVKNSFDVKHFMNELHVHLKS